MTNNNNSNIEEKTEEKLEEQKAEEQRAEEKKLEARKLEEPSAKKRHTGVLVGILIAAAAAVGISAGVYNSRQAEAKLRAEIQAEQEAAARSTSAGSAAPGANSSAAPGANGSAANTASSTKTASQAAQTASASDEGLGLKEEELGKTIFYKGKQYKRKENLSTILFMGVDDSEGRKMNEPIGNGGRSDTIILFVLNNDEQKGRMLQVSRNTMTEIDMYNLEGEYVHSPVMQITMQYAYGESRLKSCWLMKKAVSHLLYGTRIDGYLSMTMDAISLIVDLLGGITATLPEDYTYIDESYTKGAEVTFDGKSAEKFVRYRDIEELGSNETRMDRQAWFMQQMFAKLKSSPNRADLLASLLDKADKYIETDLEAEKIRDLARYDLAGETLTVPGEIKEGFAHDEYYVDEKALKDLIVELYYEPAE